MRLSVSSSKRLWRCCTDYNLPGRSSSLTHCQQLLKDVNKGDLKRRDARRPPLLHRQGCMQEGISIFFFCLILLLTQPVHITQCVCCMRLATEIFNELLLPPFVSPDTFSIGSHTGLAHPIVIGGNLFFLLSVMKLIYLTNAESTRVYRFFFFVIFIPNEILGEKIILTKTHIRIQKVWQEFGCSKMEKSSTSTVSNMMIDSIITEMGDVPEFFFSTIDSITRAPKKMHYHYQCTKFHVNRTENKTFFKIFFVDKFLKKKIEWCWERNRKELKFPPR